MNRLNVITGHFGSGKTEIAINLAKKLKDEGKEVTLLDLDIVNPYFCIRDLTKELTNYGIKVISANPSWSNAELMVVPAEAKAAFHEPDRYVIIDVGGDDMGATVLGQFNSYFKEQDHDMYFVINANRPLTDTIEGVKEYIDSIEMTSRLKVTKLISNTHMSYESTAEDTLEGDKMVLEYSEKTGLEYAYTAVMRQLVEEVKGKVHGEILPMDIYMKPPWR